MLERLTSRQVARLWGWSFGQLHQDDIVIAELLQGTVIKVKTSSGNMYLFEIDDPAGSSAHVIRREGRPMDLREGYLGLRKVSPVFSLGEEIEHGSANTSLPTHFFLIEPGDLEEAEC